MKRTSLWVCFALALCIINGCATTKVATRLGTRISNSYQEAAAMGLVSADKSVEAWPYISGLIKGVYADNYELEVPLSAKNIISALDLISKKEILTAEDKGLIIGYFCRLEVVAIREGWSKYGVTILDAMGVVF